MLSFERAGIGQVHGGLQPGDVAVVQIAGVFPEGETRQLLPGEFEGDGQRAARVGEHGHRLALGVRQQFEEVDLFHKTGLRRAVDVPLLQPLDGCAGCEAPRS